MDYKENQNPDYDAVSQERKDEIQTELLAKRAKTRLARKIDEAEENRTVVTRRTAVGFLGVALAGLIGRSIIDVLRPGPPRENIPTPTLIPTQNPVPTPERLPTNTPITFTKRSYSVPPNETVPEAKLDPRSAATATAFALNSTPTPEANPLEKKP